MKDDNRKLMAIVGPTASGKTGIGVKLAKEFNGEIVSADSRQVFRGLNLGTGKEGIPCKAISNNKFLISNKNPNDQLKNGQINDQWKLVNEKLRPHLRCVADIPQWMIDICEPGEKFTLFDYLPLARLAIDDIFSRGKLPIIVGGTGLYVQGLVEGFELEPSDVISTPQKLRVEKSFNKLSTSSTGKRSLDYARDDMRADWDDAKKYPREQLNNLSIKQLQEILQEIDIKAYEDLSDKQNPHRLIRAIEKAQEGLKPEKKKPDFEALQIGIDLSREELNKRIDKRVDDRFEQGMLDEVVCLLKSGINSEWLLNLGLEYRIIGNFVIKIANLLNCSLADLPPLNPPPNKGERVGVEFELMKEELKLRSHQYAKRQMTWFKRFPEIQWLNNYEAIEEKVKRFLSDC